MNIIVMFLVLFVVFPFVNRIMWMHPLLGIALYSLLIFAYVSYIKNRRETMYSAYQKTQEQSQQTYQKASNSRVKKDVIDVEFSEEEL